jgi:hypothetical protein
LLVFLPVAIVISGAIVAAICMGLPIERVIGIWITGTALATALVVLVTSAD